MPQTRVCRQCGRRRPIDSFYSNRQAKAPGADPLRPECKACTLARRLYSPKAAVRKARG
jgi:hypothetical protein